MSNFICVFDIESIPDAKLIRKMGFVGDDDYELSKNFAKEYELKHSTTFLPLPYHKIICICAVLADSFGNFIKVASLEGKNEEELIKTFFKMINKSKPKLVSFNGKGYDMPLLVLRALQYNTDASSYLCSKDKWNNYKSRYTESFHCDLLESLAPFNSKGCNLDIFSKLLNFPGKYDVSGDDVMRLYYEKKMEKIKEYCQSDVLNTYLLYLKYELIKRNILEQDYKNYLYNMQAFLEKDTKKGYSEIFIKALSEEISSLKDF